MRQVWTTGYSNWHVSELHGEAVKRNAIVVDIRKSPYSNREEWQIENLVMRMGEWYGHLPQWGNKNYKGGPIEIVDFDSGLRMFRAIKRNVILMCGCSKLTGCHRSTIANRLRQHGIESEELLRTINHNLSVGEIPVLALWQPWASLIVWNEKRFETRGWWTDYRGPVYIMATKKWDREIKDYCLEQPFRRTICNHLAISDKDDAALLDVVRARMPFGALVATAEIAECLTSQNALKVIEELGGPFEREFGGYEQGRAAFQLINVKALSNPVLFTGRQGWFNAPLELPSHGEPVRAVVKPTPAIQYDLFEGIAA